MHIGKVSILPAVFHEDRTIKDYYLYISPEYILSPYNQRTNPNMDANNDWLKLNFISTKNNELLGFKSEQNNGLCSMSSDGQIFNPDNNEWSSPVSGENGKLVFDTVNSSALFLGNDGIKFLGSNKEFACNALSQWVAPANQIESVSDDLVISSFDNHTLATCIPTGFNRELLSQRNLHLSARPVDGKRLSMGFSSGNITVNEVASKNMSVPSNLNIFKNAVNIRLLNIISEDLGYGWWNNQYPIWYPEQVTISKWRERVRDNEGNFIKPWQWTTVNAENFYNDDYAYEKEITSFYYYVNPDTGEFKKKIIILDITPYLGKTIEEAYAEYGDWIDEGFGTENVYSVYQAIPKIQNNQIGLYLYLRTDRDYMYSKEIFVPISDVPTEIQSWNDTANNGLTLNSLCYPSVSVDNAVSKKLSCCLNAIFTEVATNTKFAYEIPTIGKTDNEGNFYGKSNIQWLFLNYGNSSSYKKDYRNRNRSMGNLHLIVDGNSNWDFLRNILIFRSDLNSDVFDFDNELLRSVVP